MDQKVKVRNITNFPIEGGINLERYYIHPHEEMWVSEAYLKVLQQYHPLEIEVATKPSILKGAKTSWKTKVALVTMFKNDADILPLTMPKVPQKMFDKIIFLDTGSTDGSREILTKIFPTAIFIDDRIPGFDWGRWRTLLMREANKQGCTWAFMLDSDEAMFKEEYEIVFDRIEKNQTTNIWLARVNMSSENTWRAQAFPDYQARVLRVDAGFYYDQPHHSQPKLNGDVVSGEHLIDARLFHYSWIHSNEKRTLKHLNYDLSTQGKPILDTLPKDYPVTETEDFKDSQPFREKQPLSF